MLSLIVQGSQPEPSRSGWRAAARTVWRPATWLVGNFAVEASRLTFRWFTGAVMLPPVVAALGYQPRFTRGVRAAGRGALTTVAAGAAVRPVATIAVVGALMVVFAATVAVVRWRNRRPDVIRVNVMVGRPGQATLPSAW